MGLWYCSKKGDNRSPMNNNISVRDMTTSARLSKKMFELQPTPARESDAIGEYGSATRLATIESAGYVRTLSIAQFEGLIMNVSLSGQAGLRLFSKCAMR